MGSVPRPHIAPIPLWYWGSVTPTGADGGWVGPIPILNIGSVPQQAPAGGWQSPLPFLAPQGGNLFVVRSGYFGVIPVLPIGGDIAVVQQESVQNRRTYFTMLGRRRGR